MPTTPKPLCKSDYEALAEFRYSLRRFLRFSEEAATRHGLTPQQYQALLAIQGYPGRSCVTIGELAERMCITHQSAVGLADRLEAVALIRRTPAPGDRRRVLVELTPEGLERLEQLYLVHHAELKACGPHLAGLLQKAVDRYQE